jgi:hypothetical protein
MSCSILTDKDRIMKITDSLVSHEMEVKVRIGHEKTVFTTRVIKASEDCNRPMLIIQKLIPEYGNALLQSSSAIVLEFSVNGNLCQCPVEYIGINHDLGFSVSLPESIAVEEKRRHDRYVYKYPEVASVLLKWGQGHKEEQDYYVEVVNCSRHGLGLLVSENSNLLRMLKKGDRLQKMRFYTNWAVIEVNGTVVHKTKVETGEHKGSYIVGIQSDEVIEYCKLWRKI